jgi:hypothetical protein
MQPLFEAISNAIHSVQSRFGETVSALGKIEITVNTNRNKDQVWATVEDNGLGLDEKNWDAFTETDTGNKISIGGKGVGRLLWLDCFQNVSVASTYKVGGGMERRTFDFVLKQDDQIQNETVDPAVSLSFPRARQLCIPASDLAFPADLHRQEMPADFGLCRRRDPALSS